MKAEAKSLRFLGESNKLSVPFFQRNYVWTKGNWEELLCSMENADVTPFLGSLILKEQSGNQFTIIDGQQRLTTVTILAKAIYDALPDEVKVPGSGVRNGIENFLFYRTNAADDFKDSFIKIEHSRIDNQDYSRVIKSGILGESAVDLQSITDDSSNILKCYKYYRIKLAEYSVERLKSLFTLIFDGNRKVIIVIELGKDDVNEQTIFDTINRAGVRLSAADIIKNNLFKCLLEKCENNETQKAKVVDIYKECWDSVFFSTQKTCDIWDEERIFGNIKHSNLEFLLYCVACIKWGEDCDMFPKLEVVYARETENMNYLELVSLINEIKEYANIYMEYVLKFSDEVENDSADKYFKYSNHIDRLLLILLKFKIQMFYPYVLKRLYEVNKNTADQSLISDFLKLESFIIRRKLSTKGTHDYTSKCYNIIQNGIDSLVESDLANRNSGISNVDVKQYLGNVKDDTAKMILFCIELYRRRNEAMDINALEYKYTLEHIMPRKWDTYWTSIPIVDGDNTLDMEQEDSKLFRRTTIESIGNKTLLTCHLNSSISNASFEKKVNGEGDKKPGYKSHTMLLLTKEIVSSYDDDKSWNENKIKARTQKLFDEFLVLWPDYADTIRPKPENAEANDADPDLSKYTKEQLENPIELLGVI